MKSIVMALIVGTLALAASGCRTTEGAYLPVQNPRGDVEDGARFVLLDKGAQRSVTHSGIQEKYLDDGRLEVQANVRNRENRRIQVQIDCVFKDIHGFAVEDAPYQSIYLDENSQETIRFVSLSDKAKTYTVRVRQAR